MQSLGPLAAADYTSKVRAPRHKLELLVDGTWVDVDQLVSLSDSGVFLFGTAVYGTALYGTGRGYSALLESLSVTPSGAGRLPEPSAGQWSATIANPGGIFHPFHPTSAYKDYFRVGREVRISTGLEVGGVTTWHQRLQGFMEGPEYGERSVSIKGGDYMALLARKKLTGGGTGNRFWGAVETFPSIATGGTGSELYNEADACDPDTEADNVTSWTVGASGGDKDSVAGDASNFALQFTRDVAGPTEQYTQDANIFTMTAGQQYIIQFKGKIMAGTNYARLIAYETIGGAASYLGETTIAYTEGTEEDGQIVIRPTTSSALQLRVSTAGKYAAAADAVRIDNISVKTYDPATWNKYELPATCNGIYAVTLGGEFVAHGDEDSDALTKSNGGGWHYEDTGSTKIMRFSEKMQVTAGLTIKVYYFTSTALEDMVADLLKFSGVYSSRALALADMDYTPTGISIARPWFAAGLSAREALKLICERANYRFFFSGVNKPTFKPPATLKVTPDFTFSLAAQIATSPPAQDLEAVFNRVAIEGEGQSVEPGTKEKPARLTAEALDQDLIDRDGEMTWTIDNQLFQEQSALNAAVVDYLAAYKTPKWYLPVPVPFSVIPFEPGDSVTLQLQIAAGVTVEKKAIVQRVTFDLNGMNVRCEIAEGYPVVPKLPDRGAHEWQSTVTPPVSVALPDRGAHEWQGA